MDEFDEIFDSIGLCNKKRRIRCCSDPFPIHDFWSRSAMPERDATSRYVCPSVRPSVCLSLRHKPVSYNPAKTNSHRIARIPLSNVGVGYVAQGLS